jgi:hypothetical protein
MRAILPNGQPRYRSATWRKHDGRRQDGKITGMPPASHQMAALNAQLFPMSSGILEEPMPRLFRSRLALPFAALVLVTLLGGCVYPAYPGYGYYGGGPYYGGYYGGGGAVVAVGGGGGWGWRGGGWHDHDGGWNGGGWHR